MGTYIARRLIQSVFILFGLTIIFFLILHLTPGGPCATEGQAGLDAAALKHACMVRYGLDKPLPVQYWRTMVAYAHGDLGTNESGIPVIQVFLSKLPATLLLMGTSYLLQQLIALPLGVFAALKQYTFFDQLFTFFVYCGLSTPTFWLGLILIYVFAVQFQWLPVGKVTDLSLPIFFTHDWFVALSQNPPLVLGDLARHLVMPMFVLMVTGIAVDSRYMRASMLEVIRQDYVRTAKAKGLTRRTVIFKHAFRNALLPIITNVGLYLPLLIGGAIITETIFTWGGLGYTFYTAVQDYDYSLVQGIAMFLAVAVLLANLLTDLTYAWVDPRIHFD